VNRCLVVWEKAIATTIADHNDSARSGSRDQSRRPAEVVASLDTSHLTKHGRGLTDCRVFGQIAARRAIGDVTASNH
jgi:hypothetical protein